MSRYFRLPSPALVVASAALFVALTGGAAAESVIAGGHATTSTSLARRVTALETKVKRLQSQQSATQAVVGLSMLLTACGAVTTADALQGTWQTIDQLSAATQAGKTYFGPQTPIDDTFAGQHACTVLKVGRSHAVPPTINWFNLLLRPFR